TSPFSVTKMNAAGLVPPPDGMVKSVVVLDTWPVGEPLGMATTRVAILIGWPLTSPAYRVLTPCSLEDTQKAPLSGAREIPQALIRLGSRSSASPGMSDTRNVGR